MVEDVNNTYKALLLKLEAGVHRIPRALAHTFVKKKTIRNLTLTKFSLECVARGILRKQMDVWTN